MQSKSPNITLNRLLFYFCYTISLFKIMFGQVQGLKEILNVINYINIGLLLLLCLINSFKMGKKTFIIVLCICTIGAITKLISNKDTILMLVLMIIASKHINFEKLVKYDIKIKSLFTIIVSILYFCGLTSVNLHFRNGIVRHSMGFSNPNVFSTFVMSIAMEYIYLHRNKLKVSYIFITLVSIFIINYYADSRTNILCLLLVLFYIVINKVFKNKISNNKTFDAIVPFIFIILTVISFYALFLYEKGNATMLDINKNTSGRIATAYNVYKDYGINLFGNKLELVTSLQAKLTGKKSIALDNIYIYSLLSYGLIPFSLIALFFYKYFKYTIENDDYVIKIIMLIFLIGGIMERFSLEYYCNIFLLYYSNMIYNKNTKNNKEEKYVEQNL